MNQQKRATFEDVCIAQDILTDFIDTCIEKNEPLNKENRKKFINSFRLSTLGLGSEKTFSIQGKHQLYNLGHVGHAAYWLAYQTKNPVHLGSDVFEMEQLWLHLRDLCFSIFPFAQEMSIKISKEIVDMYHGNTSSYDYGDI